MHLWIPFIAKSKISSVSSGGGNRFLLKTLRDVAFSPYCMDLFSWKHQYASHGWTAWPHRCFATAKDRAACTMHDNTVKLRRKPACGYMYGQQAGFWKRASENGGSLIKSAEKITNVWERLQRTEEISFCCTIYWLTMRVYFQTFWLHDTNSPICVDGHMVQESIFACS